MQVARSGPMPLEQAILCNAYMNTSQQLQKNLYDPSYMSTICLRYCMMLIGVVWSDEYSIQYSIGWDQGWLTCSIQQQQGRVGQGRVVAGPVLHLLRTIVGALIAASMALLSNRGLPIEEFTNAEYTVKKTYITQAYY